MVSFRQEPAFFNCACEHVFQLNRTRIERFANNHAIHIRAVIPAQAHERVDVFDSGNPAGCNYRQIRHCRSHLADFKVPRKITFLSADELPKTSTGKVQKYLLVRDCGGNL